MNTADNTEKEKRKHRRRVSIQQIESECQKIKQYLASGVADNKIIRDEMGLNPFQFKHRLQYIAKQNDVSTDSDHLIVQYRLRKQALLSDVQKVKKQFVERKDADGNLIAMNERGLLACVKMEHTILEDEMNTLMTMGVIKTAPLEVNHTTKELHNRWLDMLGLKPLTDKKPVLQSSTPISQTSGLTNLN